MRVKQIIPGVNNHERFRVIVNGVGFFTTVKEIVNMPFSSQRAAVMHTIHDLKTRSNTTSVGTTHRYYNSKMEPTDIHIQVDLA